MQIAIAGFGITGAALATLLSRRGLNVHLFDWVFGCDGGGSTLRQLSQLPFREHRYACGALWHVDHTNRVHGQLFQATKGTQRLCGLLPTGEGGCSFFGMQRRTNQQRLALILPVGRLKHCGSIPKAKTSYTHYNRPTN